LAPRDVVARMILSEMEKEDDQCMFLDISHMDSDWIKHRFPTIYEHCLARGIDMTKEPMPVVPAANYHCGGIKVDLNGQTSVARLYAAGEVSCTGMHGANRLASTSLLEALVWGCAVAKNVLAKQECGQGSSMVDTTTVRIPEMRTTFGTTTAAAFSSSSSSSSSSLEIEAVLKELQATMWDYVGAKRTTEGMLCGMKRLAVLEAKMDRLCKDAPLTAFSVGVRNAVKTGKYIAEAAFYSPISVGTHYIMSDDPVSDSNSDDSDNEHHAPVWKRFMYE